MTFDQSEYDLRCAWGLAGVHLLAPVSDVVIIVDVLRFSTAVDVALSQGASVRPRHWNASRDAGTSPLSPSALQSIPTGATLVMPSPNGSTLAMHASCTAATFTACLRNCRAVADCARKHGSRIAVIPAGERWPDGSLRPAIEDLIGSGAVLAALPGRPSPEAEIAIAAFEHFRGNLRDALMRCSSGKELIARGLASDVELASDYSISRAVPILREGRFVDFSGT
ncbi:MAG: 2-phosphosulfolactate phosphatase [Bryobacteraceae bacterium]